MSSSATLTINVIDAQDTPPSFIGTPYFGYVYEISVPVSKKTSLSDFLLNSLQPFCKFVRHALNGQGETRHGNLMWWTQFISTFRV